MTLAVTTPGGALQTFDHTSLVQLVEKRFGVTEPNIGAWRRQTSGDLTSAFRFGAPNPFPAHKPALAVPSTTQTLLVAQNEVANNPAPTPPAVNTPPVQ